MITILLPVFNAEKTISRSVESILNQSFPDFELIIINDGSTDSSSEIIKSIHNERIKFIELQNNQGIVNALNIGIDSASRKYIARMDADDVSLPERIKIQFEFLESNPDVALCGTWIKSISSNKIWKYRPKDEEIRISSIFAPAMAHPTWMGKTSLFKSLKYRPDFPFMEDWDFFCRIPKTDNVANIPEYLLDYGTSNKIIQSPPKELILQFYKSHFPDLFKDEKELIKFIQLNFYPETVKDSPLAIKNLLNKLTILKTYPDILIEKEKYYYSKYSGTYWNKLIWKRKIGR